MAPEALERTIGFDPQGPIRATAATMPGADARVSELSRLIGKILLGAGIGALQPLAVHAQTDRAAAEATDVVEQVVVVERRNEGYTNDASAMSKLTEALADTPQSISIMTESLLDDRGVTSLNEALQATPGITLGAGEFSWQGNNPSIRGFSARDDMYLDGLRDFGSYARDPFNLEAVEVLQGPSSILFGRGSTGGAINQVSKVPTQMPIERLAVDVGSDQTRRGTLDYGRPLDLLGGSAFRLNALAHRSERADRDGAEFERYGVAPSLRLGIGTPTEITLSYLKQTADDRPDYGLPWLDGAPAAVDRSNFYGFASDYLKTDADIGTVSVTHALGDKVTLDSQVRYADYSRQSRITEPLIQGAVPAGTPLEDISVYRYVFIGRSDEDLLTAQTNARLELKTGSIGHSLVTGIEASRESSAPTFAFGIGVPSTNLVHPTPSDAFTASSTDPRVIADTEAKTVALYALDTLSIGAKWLITAGARWDRFDSDYRATRFAGPATPFNSGTTAGTEAVAQTDKAWSYRTALLYKLTSQTSLYLAGSTSFNPSAQSLSYLTSGRGLGIGNSYLDPEENRSVELGLKRELNDGRLAMSSAIFEISKTNARIPDPSNPGFNTLGGKQRVRGFAFDISGTITPRLMLTTAYAYLDGEVVSAGAGTPSGGGLANAPEHSASAWIDYSLSSALDVGFGVRYVAEQLAQTGGSKTVPSYRLFDAMIRRRLNDSLTIKLNLTNLTNELYFEQLHPWHVVPGPGFTAMLALDMTW